VVRNPPYLLVLKDCFRMLGFTDGKATTDSKFGAVPSDFGMDDVSCSGSERHIKDCDYNPEDNCSGSEGAGVICTNGGCFKRLFCPLN
jgi:hypothetical protein